MTASAPRRIASPRAASNAAKSEGATSTPGAVNAGSRLTTMLVARQRLDQSDR